MTNKKQMDDFIGELKTIDWFAKSGTLNEKYHVIASFYEAYDGYWGKRSFEVWEQYICPLEETAEEIIGDDCIDEAFEKVSAAIGDTVWNKMGELVKREKHLQEEQAVCLELFDNVKRDAAWACVEKMLNMPGFFTDLLSIYKEGWFPCSWEGEYPLGRAVVI